jgi:hypothetical protein
MRAFCFMVVSLGLLPAIADVYFAAGPMIDQTGRPRAASSCAVKSRSAAGAWSL